MQDHFLEKIVARKPTATTRIFQIVLVAAAALVILTSVLLAGPVLGVLLAVAAGWGCWALLQRQQVEYEYSVTNGDLDIDIIYAQARRKHLLTIKPDQMEELAVYGGTPATGAKVIDCSSAADAKGRWQLLYKGSQGKGSLIFEPSDQMVDTLRKFARLHY